MLVCYARASTPDQKPALQLDALKEAGCDKVFKEKASSAQYDRPQLAAAIDYMREGDTLVVWYVDRLAGSMKQPIETVQGLEDQGIGFSLSDRSNRHHHGGRKTRFPYLRSSR